ncbi:MAG: hypothetical protein U1E78_03040 [Gammaproteobacteria bacterium]
MLFLIVSLSACTNKLFQPPPYAYEQWIKKNISIEMVKADMMDCKYPNVYIASPSIDHNEYAKMQLCMQKKGYRYKSNLGTFCTLYPNLPACVETREASAKGAVKGH